MIKSEQKCLVCNKKIPIWMFACKCGNKYCKIHSAPETHECTFNYKELGKTILEKNNPKIVISQLKKV